MENGKGCDLDSGRGKGLGLSKASKYKKFDGIDFRRQAGTRLQRHVERSVKLEVRHLIDERSRKDSEGALLMLKSTEHCSKDIKLGDSLRKERVHMRLPSWDGHVGVLHGDGLPCEDGAFDNRRAVREARDDVVHGRRTSHKNAFIRVPNHAQSKGERNEARDLVQIRTIDFVDSSLDGEGKELGATSAALRHTNRREQSDETTGDSAGAEDDDRNQSIKDKPEGRTASHEAGSTNYIFISFGSVGTLECVLEVPLLADVPLYNEHGIDVSSSDGAAVPDSYLELY